MQKTCLHCGTEFTANRSDATFCSNKCRSNYNYQSKRQINKTNNKKRNEVKNVKHSINVSSIISKVTLLEKGICDIELSIKEYETNLIELQSKLLKEINKSIAQTRLLINKTEKETEMDDTSLYNNVLNQSYLDAKKSNEKRADFELKSESYIACDNRIKQRIVLYRNSKENELKQLNSILLTQTDESERLKQLAELLKEQLKEKYASLRLLQERLIRHEKFLNE